MWGDHSRQLHELLFFHSVTNVAFLFCFVFLWCFLSTICGFMCLFHVLTLWLIFFVLIWVLHADFKSIQTGHAFQPTTFILLAPVLNTHLWVSVGSRVFRQFLSAFTAKCTLKGRIHPKTHLLTMMMMMMMMFDTWQGQFFIPSVIWWSV